MIKNSKESCCPQRKVLIYKMKMNLLLFVMMIMQAARLACGTCVFESDFGFALNCNFKKSGLFRVRNLGGLKAHFGLGFSLGDELGFPESLGNVEGGRRRAISYKNGPPPNYVGALPASEQPPLEPPEKHVSSRAVSQPSYSPQQLQQLKEAVSRQLNQVGSSASRPAALMTEARPLPPGVPAFRPIPKPVTVPPSAERRASVAVDVPAGRVSVNNKIVQNYKTPLGNNRTFHVGSPTVISKPVAIPVFQAMPDSVSSFAKGVAMAESRISQKHPNYLQFEEPKFDLHDVTVDELAQAANVSVDTIKHAIYVREQQLKAEQRARLAAKLREEFLRTSTTTTTTRPTTTTSTPTTPRPRDNAVNFDHFEQNVAHENKVSKVMNAPKEYYPVGYDKDFDDNFKSKVDLPPTSFSCAKQKHFPGLYADTDLACMVFHVCALTDDGMVRKSFLCPENTLFDQTILKCNWWFYVDCSSSKSIYDSNIPISKSYQLMKSLTYFSKLNQNTNKSDGDKRSSGLDLKSLKQSMEDISDHQMKVDASSIVDSSSETPPEETTPNETK